MEISKSIVELGRTLQYSTSTQETVRLADEIQNIRDYVALRQSNKDPEFECIIEICEGGGVILPKHTLQHKLSDQGCRQKKTFIESRSKTTG